MCSNMSAVLVFPFFRRWVSLQISNVWLRNKLICEPQIGHSCTHHPMLDLHILVPLPMSKRLLKILEAPGCLVGWLADWLLGCLVAWLVGRLVGWLVAIWYFHSINPSIYPSNEYVEYLYIYIRLYICIYICLYIYRSIYIYTYV